MNKKGVESTISIKNKKIKESNIKIEVRKDIENEDLILIYLKIDQVVEPYMRPRTSGNRIYDPLATYKKTFRNKILEELKNLNNKIEIPINEDIYIKTNILVHCKIPESYSKKKKLLAYQGKYKNNKKPDVDNIAKTIYDTVEGIFFLNDSQIYEENFKKEYGEKEYTFISISINKQPNTSGKLNKQEKSLYDTLIEEGVFND